MMKIHSGKSTICFLSLFFLSATAFAQTTAFNFQGFLKDGGAAANGRYDLQFKLFNQLAGGTQIGATVDRPNLQLIEGVFSTTLDFGATVFTGGDRFIEISLRPNASPNAFVILGARQQILSVPFAARSSNATQAENATNATTSQNSLSLGGVTAANYARLNFTNQGDVSAANMSTTGYISVGGNTLQSAASNGLPKAMIYVNFDGQINRCYNGVTGVSTAGCGFTVTQPLGNVGVYRIDFGFPLAGRFPQITPEYFFVGDYNKGANFKFTGNFLEVFTFAAGNSNDTVRANFVAFLY